VTQAIPATTSSAANAVRTGETLVSFVGSREVAPRLLGNGDS
jgi:hypothetical protein